MKIIEGVMTVVFCSLNLRCYSLLVIHLRLWADCSACFRTATTVEFLSDNKFTVLCCLQMVVHDIFHAAYLLWRGIYSIINGVNVARKLLLKLLLVALL